MYWHLAQMNLAHAVAPLDDPRLADFVARIADVNRAAEQAPGFIWRDADGEPPPERAAPTLLYNTSIWESPEALHQFTYGGIHVTPFRDRARWFHPPTGPQLVLWWVPAGHHIQAAEGFARLDFLARRGPTPAAFTLKQRFPAPNSPPTPGAAVPEVSYDRRRFRALENTENGDVAPGLEFLYRQQGSRVWATYSGSGVRFGSLVAAADRDGALDMRYRHFTDSGETREGRCRSRPETLPDGRLQLHESWQWTNGDRSSGQSVIEEIP